MFLPSRPGRLVVSGGVCLALALGGCQGDEFGEPEPGLPPCWQKGELPFPPTPAIVIANLKTCYEEMNLSAYQDRVLDTEYRFVSKDEFDLDDELALSARMFSGQPDARGRVVSHIEFQRLEPRSAWQPVPADDPLFGGLLDVRYCNFGVSMTFEFQGGLRSEVQGEQLFYVVAHLVPCEGATMPVYKLIRQVDWTVAEPLKVNQTETWGSIKAGFR